MCAMVLAVCGSAPACTSLLVTGGASTDGSVMITYTCDGEFHPHLEYEPGADYEPGDSLDITSWRGELRGKVAQAPHTYSVVHLMNEHQLAIGETTFEGREELVNPEGLLHYWNLMYLALHRARTAREAIGVITDAVREYGYRSSGESFSIADTEEAWIMEMIGPGEGGEGAEWVAVRIPDGYISCHANKARIGEFPLDDPANCLYSENVISFAIEKGYYDPESGEPFRFCDVYCPPTLENRKYCSSRVWSIFRRAAPSRGFSPDYHRGVEGAEPYPLWIKPDKKLSLGDVFSLMRDHYEGTPYDMTLGVDAGPYGNPSRWRPITWTVDSVEYAWERSVSTQQTAFSMVSQSRSWLPDAVGGVLWYGVDDTYMTCYTPFYCCMDSLPRSYTSGSGERFSWDSVWWIFNLVSNYACLKYSYMAPEIQAVQSDIEGTLIALQPSVERTALDLAKSDPGLMTRYLTDYSIAQAEMVMSRWQDLAEHLITKYNDGYVRNAEGHHEEKGYPESWLRDVVELRPEQFYLKPAEQDTTDQEPAD
jgi:dipeptidase